MFLTQDPTPLKEKNIVPILGTLVACGNLLEEALDRIKKLRGRKYTLLLAT